MPFTPSKFGTRWSMINWLGRVLFGKYDPAVRRRHARALALAILVALLFCLIFGVTLYYANRLGRI